MKTAAFVLAMAAMAFGMALADTPISVNVNISHAQENSTKSGDSNPKHINRRGTHKATEVKDSTFHYTGKVSCNAPKDAAVTVTLEAYFITRSIGQKGVKDEVSSRKVIDKFRFGGDNPTQYKYTLTSPSFSQTTVTTVKTRGRRRNRSSSTEKDKSGTRLMGVIVRAMVNGKPVKVISEPSNTRWVAAGKKDAVSLD